MLIGVHPILTPDILYALASMGHGDSLVIVDANFPATSVGHHTVLGKPCTLFCDTLEALGAILTHLPVDTYSPEIPAVQGMQVVGEPDTIPPVVADATPMFENHAIALIERMAFYEAAKQAFVIIKTNEARPYGNFLIRKGVA